MLVFPARCATQPELFFRVSPPPMVPKSQLNVLPCQIKVNLRKPLCVQSERVRSRLDSPFFFGQRERESWKWLHNYIKDQRLERSAKLLSQRRSAHSCYLCDAPSALMAAAVAVVAGEAALSQGPLSPSAFVRRPPPHPPPRCRPRRRLHLHRHQPCGLR